MLTRPSHRLPAQPEMTVILNGLLGREVALAQIEPVAGPRFVAIYVNREDRPVNTVSVDLALAASMSASLALIPPASAEEWIAAGAIDQDATDNVFEVLNVLASAHNNGTDHDRHVRISELVDPGGELPAAVAAGLAAPALQRTYSVTIDGYPGGVLGVAAF